MPATSDVVLWSTAEVELANVEPSTYKTALTPSWLYEVKFWTVGAVPLIVVWLEVP